MACGIALLPDKLQMKLDSVGTINSPCNFKRSILHACGAVLDDESHKHCASKRYRLVVLLPTCCKSWSRS